MTESQLMESVRSQCSSLPVAPCAEGLFGPRRQLYKRVAQFDVLSHPEQHRKLSRRPFVEIVELSKSLASLIRARYGIDVQEHDLLIDAPPVKLEVQCQIDVRQRDGSLKSLGEMSPVVHTLATRQFDDIVKRVRIFVRPDLRERVVNIDFAALVATLID
jgi:hypothetical protein